MSEQNNTVYQQVIEITRQYFGPATERFIDRQIKNHLDKEPAKITAKDVAKLIDWIRIAVSFLTEDSKLTEEYIHQLRQVADIGGAEAQ